MNILALVTGAFGSSGGIAQANRDLITALSTSDNIESIVIIPRLTKNNEVTLPKNVKQKKSAFNIYLYSFFVVCVLIKEGPFDRIFCGHFSMSPLVFLISIISGTPYWIHMHGIESWEKPSKILRHVAENASLITTVSRFTRFMILKWSNIIPGKIKIIPNTVEEKFKPGPKPEYLLDRFDIKNKKIILTVGRLSRDEKYKGHDRIIKNIPLLLKNHPALVYVIAGTGDDRNRLEELSKTMRVEKAVKFIGYIEDDEIVDLYRMADIFAMPSTGEGFGIVFLEAMACGTPAIGLNQDGSSDPLQDGNFGIVSSTDGLLANIDSMLQMKYFNGVHLSEKVMSTFGKNKYRSYIHLLIK